MKRWLKIKKLFLRSYVSITIGIAIVLFVFGTTVISEFKDETQTNFDNGTHIGTTYDPGNSWLEISTTTNRWKLPPNQNNEWFNMSDNILLWHLDENISNTTTAFTDSSGSNNYGTCTSESTCPATTTAQLQSGMNFDGSDDYIAINNLNYNTSGGIDAITVCSWVKSTDTGTGIIATFDRNEYWRLSLHDNFNYVNWSTNDSTGSTDDFGKKYKVTDGKWHHVCGWFDSSSAPDKKIFVDGTLVNTTTAHGGNNLGSGNTRYGFVGVNSEASTFDGSKSGDHFTGSIDEVSVFNRALKNSEIRHMYERQESKYASSFESRVFDAGENIVWEDLSWITDKPYLKELPDNQGVESGYSSGNVSMTSSISLWHLDDVGTTTITDTSGFDNNGTAQNGPSQGVEGLFGDSIYFNGNTEYLEFSGDAMNSTSDKGSMSLWVKPGKIDEDQTIFWTDENRDRGIGVDSSTSSFVATMYDGAGGVFRYLRGGTLDGSWHHILFTWDITTGSLKLYVDGSLVDSYSGSSWTDASRATPTRIAYSDDLGGDFHGKVDEVAVFDKVLDSQVAENLYTRGASQLKFQVRGCDDINCSGDEFLGSDETKSSFYSELNSINATTTPTTTLNTVTGQYFQYKAFLETDDVNKDAHLKTVSMTTSSNDVPVASFRDIPQQISTTTAEVELTISDINEQITSLSIEHSTDGSSWSSSTIYSVSELGEGDGVVTSSGKISDIDTDIDGEVKLNMNWDIKNDLSGTIDDESVYMRITPQDSFGDIGSTTQSSAFEIDKTVDNDLIDDDMGDFLFGGFGGVIFDSSDRRLKLNTTTNVLWELPDNSKTTDWVDMSNNKSLLHLDESSGSTSFSDSSGNNNGGSCSGSSCPSVTSTSKFDKAFFFDGSDDWIDLDETNYNSDSVFGSNNKNMSLSVWVYPTALGGNDSNHFVHNVIFANAASSGVDDNFELGIDNNEIEVYTETTDNSGNVDRTDNFETSLSTNQWHQIVVTKSATSGLKVYQNGGLVGHNPSVTGTFEVGGTNGFDLALGKTNNFQVHFQGAIDEFALFEDRVLASSTISDIYERQGPKYLNEFTSRVFDAGSVSSWFNISWVPDYGYLKELPDSGKKESNYPSSFDMSNNVALWHLNDSDGRARDSSGNYIDSYLQGGVTTSVSGKFGKAMSFDGSDDYIDVDNRHFNSSSPFGRSNDTMSLSIWLRPGSTDSLTTNHNTHNTIFANGGDNIDDTFELGIDNGEIELYTELDSSSGTSGTEFQIPVPMKGGEWQNIVVTKSATSGMKVYYNGDLVRHESGETSAFNQDSDVGVGHNITIGKTGNSDVFYAGDLDEIALFDRELSSGEIENIYSRGVRPLRFQVRSCDDDACSGENWVGPDGTTSTFFTETDNDSLTTPKFNFNVSDNRYFQYRTIFETFNTTSPGVKSVEVSNTNEAPSTTFKTTPAQVSSTSTEFKARIEDVENQVAELTVEYSTSTNAWNNATIGSVSQNGEGDGVTTSSGKISDIDTDNDGEVNLDIEWDIKTDIPDTENSSVFLRLTPQDSLNNSGSTVSSSVFEVDTNVSSSVFTDDDLGEFVSGNNTGSVFDTTNDWLNISTSTNIWSLPNNQKSDWINMASNTLLFNFNDGLRATNFSDSSGNNNNGTCSGVSCPFSVSSGKVKKAFDFDGDNDYISIPDSNDLDFTDKLTFMTWIKRDSHNVNYARIIGKDHNSSYVWDFDNSKPAKLRFEAFDSIGSYNSNSGVPTSTWHHVAVTYSHSANELKFYIDGELDATKTTSGGPLATDNNPLEISGQGSDSNHQGDIDGSMDDLALFDRVLSGSDIKKIYDRQLPNKTAKFTSRIFDNGSPTAWNQLTWNPQAPYLKELPDNQSSETAYNEGNIDMSNNVGLWHMNSSTATDSSGNNNNGTLNGGVTTGVGGKLGKAMSFDGSDDYIDLGNLQDGQTTFTWSSWIKSKNTVDKTDLSQMPVIIGTVQGSGETDDALLGVNNGNLAWYSEFGGSNATTTKVAVNDNSFHHVVVVRDSTSLDLYVDGNKESSITVGSDGLNSNGLEIARANSSDNEFYQGLIDETAIFSSALSSSTIEDMYQRGSQRIKFQARSCNDANCSGENFLGSDGTTSTYYTELDNSSVSTPKVALNGIANNRYSQYRTFFYTDSVFSPKLKSASMVTTVNNTPTVSVKDEPRQRSTSIVETTVTVSDQDNNGTSLEVEYSTDNSTWNNATLSSANQIREGDGVSISSSTINGIDTNNDGSVDLRIKWDIGADLASSLEDNSVYLRFTPDDSVDTGSVVKSNAFEIDKTADNELIDDDLGDFAFGGLFSTEFETTNDYAQIATTTNIWQLPDNQANDWVNMSNNQLLLHLNETGSPTNFTDSSGLGNNGSCSGSSCPTPTTSGKMYGAMDFDGSDDYISTGLDIDQSSGQSLTFSGWIKPDPAGGWFFGTDNGGHDWSIGIEGDRDIQIDRGDSRWNNITPVPSNQWSHIVVVWDSENSQTRLYVNGKEFINNSIGFDSSDNNLAIGRSQYSGGCCYYNGQLDEVSVYDKALTFSTIQKIYERQAPKYSGKFTSRVFDNSTSTAWNQLTWNPQAPYLKELPDNQSSETAYNEGNIDMSNNVALYHMDPSDSQLPTTFSEGFEDDNIDPLSNTSTDDANWTTTSSVANNGIYSAKAGNITHNETVTLSITTSTPDLNAQGNISFARKVNSENNYDHLRFYVDGVKKDEWSGSVSWSRVSYNVSAGEHTFEWSYEKDGSVSDGSDTAWIDDIKLTSVESATDSSGNNNDGTLNGGVTTGLEGVFGDAMSFDGNTNSEISVDSNILSSGDEATLSMWVYVRGKGDVSYNRFLDVQNGSGGDNLTLYWDEDDDKYGFTTYSGNALVTGSDIPQRKWVHLVGVLDGSNSKVRFYQDGELKETTNTSISNFGNLVASIGGRYDDGQDNVDAKIDETAIFNTALSSTTIKDIYQRGSQRLKFQVRSCDDANCSGENFVGSDGTTSTYYTELNNDSTSTPVIDLTGVPDNRYIQYRTFFYTDTTTSPKLNTVSFATTTANNLPTLSINSTPTQLSSSTVSTTVSITDSDIEETSIDMEYSTDGNTWSNATVGSASDLGNEGDGVTFSGNTINGIDTDNDGTVNLSIGWGIQNDIAGVDDSSVYLRLTPSDVTGSGTTESSTAFSVDVAAPTKPGILTPTNVASSSFSLNFPSTTSSDPNFDEYKIFISSSTPASAGNNDVSYTSTTDSNLSDSNFNGVGSTNSITGLVSNITYYFNLFAFDTWGNTTSSDRNSTTTLAVVPSNLVTSSVAASSITLTWGANGNSAGTVYEITNVNTSATTTNTNYTFSSLDPDTQYDFKVRAQNSAGKYADYTNATTEYTYANVPIAPTVNNPSTTTLDITINENGNPSQTTYAIFNETDGNYLASDGGDNGGSSVYQTTSTWSTATAKNLSANTQYEFTTKAQNQDGAITATSSKSSAIYTFAATPVNLATTTITTSSVSLSWGANGNPGGTKYRVENITDNNTATTTNTSINFNNLDQDTDYDFRVRAQNGDSVNTSFTPTLTANTNAGAPPAPPLSNVITSTIDLTIATGANPTSTEYAIYNETDGNYIALDGTSSGSIAEYYTTSTWGVVTMKNLSVNKLYNFKTIAQSGGAETTTSTGAATTTLAASPVNLTTSTINTSSISLNWGANGNPGGTVYEVENITDNNTVTTTSTNQNFSSLNPDTQYQFRLRAQNNAGVYTNYTNTLSEYTHANTPNTPTVNSATSSTLDITINENGNPSQTTYAIYNETDNYYLASDGTNNGSNPVYQTVGTWGSATAKNLSVNTQYEFSTKAQNQDGVVTPTSTKSSGVYTLAQTPSNLSDTNITTSSISMSWDANGNPSGTIYEFRNDTSNNTVTTTNTNIALTNLDLNTEYKLKVRAQNDVGSTTPYTSASTEYTRAATPSAPTADNPSTTTLYININENNNPSQTTYAIYNETGNYYLAANGSSNGSTPIYQSTSTWGNITAINLSPNVQYEFSTRAQNQDGVLTNTSTNSSAIYTLGDKPTNLTTTTVSTSSISLSWNAGGNPAGTEYRAKNITDNSVSIGTSTNVTFDSLDPDKEYKFKVATRNGDGTLSDYTPTTTEVTLAKTPSAFTASNITTSSINLVWNDNGNPSDTTYEIENITSSTITTTSTTSTLFSGLDSNNQYQFRVRAQNREGQLTSYTSTTSAYTYAKIPTAPTLVNSTQTSLELDWTGNGSEYRLHTDDNSKNFTGITSKPYTVSGLTCETDYTFEVSAFNGSGMETSFSQTSTVSTASCPEPEPTISGGGGGGLSASQQQSTIQIENVNISQVRKNSAVINVDTNQPSLIKILYGKNGQYQFQTQYQDSFAESRSVTLTNLAHNARYNIKIEAKDTNQRIVTSDPYYFNTLPEIKAPPTVSNFRALFDQASRAINLFWDNPDVSEFSNVKLLRSTSTYPSLSVSGNEILSGGNEGYTDSGVSEDTTYFYSIFVKSKQGLFSSGAITSASTPLFETEGSSTEEDSPEKEPAKDITTTTEPIELPEEGITSTEPVEESEESEESITTTPPTPIEELFITTTLEETVEKEPLSTTTELKEPTKESEIPDKISDEEAFKEVQPAKPLPTPELVTPLSSEESAVEEKQINLFSFVKQNIQKGLNSAKDGASQLSEDTQDKLRSVKGGLVDHAGQIQQDIYENLSSEEKEKVDNIADNKLPPKFDTSTIAKIQPLEVGSEKAKKVGADWHVFSGSKAMITIPQSAFRKEVDGITVSMKSNGYILNYNPETNNFEGVVNVPEQKGKYEVLVRVFYKDDTFEEVKKTALVDPYGYVYKEKYGEFSITDPLNIFDKKRVPIKDSVVTIYTKNKVNEWVKWPAHLYNQQNPQTTAKDGRYAFIVPPGEYYIEVKHRKYPTTKTDLITVKEEVINKNIKIINEYPLRREGLLIITIIILGAGVGVWGLTKYGNITKITKNKN